MEKKKSLGEGDGVEIRFMAERSQDMVVMIEKDVGRITSKEEIKVDIDITRVGGKSNSYN